MKVVIKLYVGPCNRACYIKIIELLFTCYKLVILIKFHMVKLKLVALLSSEVVIVS